MRLASTSSSTSPFPPPPQTLEGARIGIERAMATAGVAAWSPRSSTSERLRDAAGLALAAATVLAASQPDGTGQDFGVAIRDARLGAATLERAAQLRERADAPDQPPGHDPFAAVSAASYDAYDLLRAAYLAAGGT